MSEFEKYARNHCGISSLKLHDFQSVSASYVSPTIIEERQLNIATMDVFSRLMMDRIIFLGAPIYDDAANIIQAQLLFLESVDPEKDIQIYINSPGGSVSAGLGIYDTMQLVNSDVATICTGLAASMGAVLLTAGAKGKRSALPHSRVMIHQPLGGAQGQASDIEITAREIMKTKRELYEILAAHSGVSVRKIEKDADRDYWLSAREAKEYGLMNDLFPYCIVKLDQGMSESSESTHDVSTKLIIGIFDDGLDAAGYKDILNIIEDIRCRFRRNPILNGRYMAKDKMEWALPDDDRDTFPYFFGALYLEWQTVEYEREDELA